MSATNPEDYKLVKQIGSENLHIKYQPEAFFSQDLERHVYTNGYMTKGYTDFIFEVDEDWKPYWMVTIYDSKIGFGGDDATELLVIDPETGAITHHPIDKTPSWIDRVQPVDFVRNQADDWGEYIHGWPNWSGNDKLSASEEYSVVLGSDGRVYYYISLLSKGKENSTVGFMMVDARSKAVKWYRQAGATEQAARSSAEGKVQQMGYVGSEGITYNIDGIATYEFLLKDKGGLMKQIALVSVHDHTIVGVGETRQQAMRNYRSELASHGNAAVSGPSQMQKKTVVSTVQRISSDVTGGNTDYYLMVTSDNWKGHIFTGTTSTSIEIALTKAGDQVQITFVESERKEIELKSFVNLSLKTQLDSSLVRQTAQIDTIRESGRQEKRGEVVDNTWENMSPQEKERLIQQREK